MQISGVSNRAVVAASVAVVGVLAGVWQIVAVAQRGNATSPVVGVWRVSEITTPGRNGTTNTSPQPNVFMLTTHYFSHNGVISDAPRPELPPSPTLTDKDIADAAKPFLSNAGTYELKGNEIVVRPIVALNPHYMRAGFSKTYSFRLEGKDTLWLSQTATADGAIQDPVMLKLTRLE
jgi:hypothetical protein